MKARLCDVCLKTKEELVFSDYRIRIRHNADYNIDVCEECSEDVPEGVEAHKKFVEEVLWGLDSDAN